ncbi:MAG: LbtU family siderophore porin [Gammaproteobacteria bacterium]
MVTAQAAQTNSMSQADMQQAMQKILSHQQQLEQQIAVLKRQVSTLKRQQTIAQKASAQPTKSATHTSKSQVKSPTTSIESVKNPDATPDHAVNHLLESHYFGGAPVVISPFLGLRNQAEDQDLIVNISNINTDLRLLQQQQALRADMTSRGMDSPRYPLLEISGELETQALYRDPYNGRKRGDVNLSSVELDFVAEVARYINGFLSIEYEDGENAPPRVDNSNVRVRQGFVLLGNLDDTPVYASIGQMFVPTGAYHSYMVSSPLTLIMGRTRTRAVLVGYQQPGNKGFNGSVYAFNGDIRSGSSRRYGANAEYVGDVLGANYEVGVAYASNLAESEGIQSTGNGGFDGFGGSSASEDLRHSIPAVDLYGKINMGPVGLIAEYVAAVRGFDSMDLTFNGNGARPDALNLEAAYETKIWDKPTSFALGYGHSREALGLNLPEHRYIATISTSIWRNTIESIEFVHDVNYGASDRAAGRGANGNLQSIDTSELGRNSDTLTAQIGIYF